MGRRKTTIKIPKNIMLKCPHCLQASKAVVSIENCPQSCICPKCNNEIRTPLTQCCIICAFSGKKCPRTLLMEAKAKGLEIR